MDALRKKYYTTIALSTTVDMEKITCHSDRFIYILQGLSLYQNIISHILQLTVEIQSPSC